MSATKTTFLDTVNLLTFPSRTKGLSAYKPGLDIIIRSDVRPTIENASPTSSIDSPPRKAARLEGDADHTSSAIRSRAEAKGKSKVVKDDGAPIASLKKLVLVNPPEDDLSESYLNSLPPIIHKSITAVLNRPKPDQPPKQPPYSYESVFQATQTTVVIAKRGQWVYDKLKFELKEASSKVSRQLCELEIQSSVDWVDYLVDSAAWYSQSIKLLESLLTYLDRVFVMQNSDVPHIRQLAMGLFEAHVFKSALIAKRTKDAVAEWVRWERTERQPHPNRAAISAVAQVLSDYSLFSEYFLTAYLEETNSFYVAESDSLSVYLKDDPRAFIEHVGKRIEEEKTRWIERLIAFEPQRSDVLKATERSLMENRLKWLCLGIVKAVDKKNKDGLAQMYYLFSRVDGLKMLCDAFKAHVHNRVSDIVNDKEHEEDMVDRLLDFKGFIDEILPYAFSDVETISSTTATQPHASSSTVQIAKPVGKKIVNRDFMYAATDAFSTGFRVRRNKPAEMIAKFLDRAMRRGQKGASDEQFMKILDSVLGLYRFTQDKDVFRTFYHRALSKRLLLQRSASDDFEKAVLKKLKEQFDPEFSMGDNMFRDLALSRDLMREFHEKAIGSGSAQNLNVMVLQRSFWPFSAKTKDDIPLPPSMQDDLTKFSTFYKNKHQGRKLDFDHSLGTVQMRARFKAGEKELSVGLYQAVVLLLFNDQEEIGFLDIKMNTGMEDAELRRTLQSLACANKKVLKKRPVGRDVNDTDVFYFNSDFTDPKTRVHINSIQAKETPEESLKTQSAIEGDRKHYLDAAIVRVMKAKKTLGHQQLITMTIDAVKAHFAPDVRMIKERIEQLIEQEYMRRDEDKENVYVYVA